MKKSHKSKLAKLSLSQLRKIRGGDDGMEKKLEDAKKAVEKAGSEAKKGMEEAK